MARRRRATAKRHSSGTRPIVVRAPSPKPIVVRAPAPASRYRRARGAVSGAARRVSAAALSEKHTMTALATAAVLGLAERSNIQLPRPIASLSTPATYGIALWMIGKYSKSQRWQHAATGLLAIAIRDLAAGKTPAGQVVGDTDGVDGDAEVHGVGAMWD